MAYLDAHREVLELFIEARYLAPRGEKFGVGWCIVSSVGSWATSDPATQIINPWDWRRRRSVALRTGKLPRRVHRGRPSYLPRAKQILRELRLTREAMKGRLQA